MTTVMHTLSKMTTDDLVRVLVGELDMPNCTMINSQHGWDCLIEILDKRLTPEQMAALEDGILETGKAIAAGK